MRGFELDQLRTFAVVAEAGSLSAAAPMLHLSQSTVSEQVRKLEARAGLPLFVRSKFGVATTPAGARLLEHARRIVALNEAAFDDLHGQSIKGELRVAITDYFRTGEIASMLARLRECYPELRLHMSTMKSADIEQAYGRGQFDIGVVMSVAADTVQRRAADPRWVLRREALAWVAAPTLAARIPDPLPLVLLSDDCLLHQAAVRALNQQNVHHVMVHSASGVAGLQSVLAAGLGVGCLCASAVGEGVVRLGSRHGLPALKEEAVFSLLPPRQNESVAVARARDVLARQLLV